MTLAELRTALVVATGPDLDLNVEIMVLACGWDRARARQLCPHVTGSIDAAGTLVPEGWHLQLFQDADGWLCRLKHVPTADLITPHEGENAAPRSRTGALALCLARVEYEIGRRPGGGR